MKKLFFCVFLLLGICMVTNADLLIGQSPFSSIGESNAKIMGRPWETDESAVAAPSDFLPGRGSSQASGHQWMKLTGNGNENRSHIIEQSPEVDPYMERDCWSRLMMIFHNLFWR
ncbi:MAG: hypothetical protein ACE5OP_13445 [Candidatus Glassbacteria bacterium]